jgi:hypothetical protein
MAVRSTVVTAPGYGAPPVQRMRDQWVDATMSTPPIGGNSIANFLAQANAATRGVDVSFAIADAKGMASVTLLRAEIMDAAQATVLQTWSASASAFTWSDTDKLLQQMGQAFYWLKLEPVNATGTAVTVGPQFILLNPSLLPPLPLGAVSASHAAAVNGAVLTTCNVSPIASGDSVKIYVTGYHGSASAVAVAESTAQSPQFNLDATGETVTIKAIAVSSGGAEALSGPTCTLTLGGTATAAAQVEDLTVIQIATGNQVQWPSSLEAGVTGYELYRGQRGDTFADASLLATVAASSAGTMIYLDTAGLGGDYQYFVVVEAASGNSPASPAANPQVLFSSSQIPPNATANTTNTATLDSIDAGSSATVRIYGPGGVGTSYSRQAGFGTETRPAGTITGLAYNTRFYVLYEVGSATYLASTAYSDSLPDGYEWVGTLVTTPAGGAATATCDFDTAALSGGGGAVTVSSVFPVTAGSDYGSASVTVSGGTFSTAARVNATCSGGSVVSYTVAFGGRYTSTSGLTMTVNRVSPYTGGGDAAGGARYVQVT